MEEGIGCIGWGFIIVCGICLIVVLFAAIGTVVGGDPGSVANSGVWECLVDIGDGYTCINP
ncbi:MAG: hypothetical protein WBP54_04285 [Pelodictyon phaeoclathratiforme]